MFTHKLLIALVIIVLTTVFATMVCSENSPVRPDQAFVLPPDWQEKSKTGPYDQYQFFSPQPSESEYLILDPDGTPPSNYQKLLDKDDKKPND